jgi:hypothetical protein
MKYRAASLTRSLDDASSRSASSDASVTTDVRTEYDRLGAVEVQTQRSLGHFSIGQDLMPCEIITAYAILKRSAAIANHKGGRLDDGAYDLIVKVRDELLDGQQPDAVQHERQRGDLKPLLPDRPDERTPPACRRGAVGKVAIATLETDIGKISLPAIAYMRRVRTENATIGSSQGGATDMTVPIAGVAIKPDLQRTTMAGIRARTISTASGPAPILAHTGVAGLPRGRGSSDRARRSGCFVAAPSCGLLLRNRK